MGKYQATVVSIGRKWIQCSVSGTKRNYKAHVLINEVSRNWAVGETYQFEAQYDEASDKVKLTPQPPDTSEEHRLAEGERWMSYVRRAAEEKHYIYERGINELRALDLYEVYEAEIESLQANVMDSKAAYFMRKMRSKANAGHALDKLIEQLSKTGKAPQYEREVHELVELCYAVREEKRQAAAKQRREAAAEKKNQLVEIPWDFDKGKVGRGTYIYHKGSAYRVTTCAYQRTGGFARGANAEEWYLVRAEDVSKTRAGAEFLDREDEGRRTHIAFVKARGVLRDSVNALIRDMEKHGRRVECTDGQPVLLPVGDMIFDSVNAEFGFGVQVLIEPREDGESTVWYNYKYGTTSAERPFSVIRHNGEMAYGLVAGISHVRDTVELLIEKKHAYTAACNDAGMDASTVGLC